MNLSNNFPDAFYRVSIRGLIIDGDKVLLGRHKEGEIWETFGGGLDFGENPHEALKREITEETGCDVLCISEKPIFVLPHIVHNKRGMDWFYNFPVYYEIKIDISNFDFSLQYPEIKWFTIEEIQNLSIFEGEESLKQALKNILSKAE